MTDEDSTEQSWQARVDGRVRTVTVAADGLRITGEDGEEQSRYAWSDLDGVSFPDGYTAELTVGSDQTVVVTFHAGALQRAFRAALGDTVAVTAAKPRAFQEAVDLDGIDYQHRPGSQPLSTALVLWAGVLLSLVAAGIIVAASSSESSGAVALGYVLAVLGSSVLGVGIVALGVRLGLDEHAWRRDRLGR